jgi:hypothetical protein
MMQNASEGAIREVTYWWPRPDSDKPLEKTTFHTKVGADLQRRLLQGLSASLQSACWPIGTVSLFRFYLDALIGTRDLQ